MSLKRTLIAGSIVAVFALAGCSSAGGSAEKTAEPTESANAMPEADLEGVPEVVAVVNDEEIGLDEFTEAYETQLQQAAMTQQQSGQELDQDQLKQQTAELLVNNVLLTQAAEGAGIEASNEDIDGVLKDVATQSGLSSVDEVIKAFDEQGVPEDEVREDAANQFEIEQYVTNETDIQPPSDDELKAQYDQLVEQSKAQGEQSGQEAEIPPFEDVKQQLSDQAVAQEQNEATQTIIDGLREDGKVDIKL
ncbi:MAG TPA: SurA N-terminal domain-containing protein [Microbacterium sp.]|nr:SurA N-terminal domain-containing protein [Microbacterium sp.]